MTEAEWLASEDIDQMLACLVKEKYPDAEPCDWKHGERKKRLFVYACVRRIWDSLPPEYRAVLEMLDPDADGLVSAKTRHARWSAAERVTWEHGNLLFAVGYDDIALACFITAEIAATASGDRPGHTQARQQQEHREQVSLLRCIFANPFRPAAVDSSWLTWNGDTLPKLAQAIYDERRFADLPLLADALEEAGCTNADLLDHCRRPGEHVRGCWVVDLLLGKA